MCGRKNFSSSPYLAYANNNSFSKKVKTRKKAFSPLFFPVFSRGYIRKKFRLPHFGFPERDL